MSTQVWGINDRGQIVGISLSGPPTAPTPSGFLRDAGGRLTAINRPGTTETAALDLDHRGQIAIVAPDPPPSPQPTGTPPRAGWPDHRRPPTQQGAQPTGTATHHLPAPSRSRATGETPDSTAHASRSMGTMRPPARIVAPAQPRSAATQDIAPRRSLVTWATCGEHSTQPRGVRNHLEQPAQAALSRVCIT
jgi:hypothetical protein